MTFTDSIQTVFRKYATFDGRASRSEFWWWVLFVSIASSILNLIPMIGIIFTLATLVPYFAVYARRLHDGGRSGWWQVAPIGMAVLALAFYGMELLILSYVAFAAVFVLAILLFAWLIQVGNPGPNRFGNDPLGGAGPDFDGGDDDKDDYVRTRIPTVNRD